MMKRYKGSRIHRKPGLLLLTALMLFVAANANAQSTDTTMNTAVSAAKTVRATHRITLDNGFSADGANGKLSLIIGGPPVQNCVPLAATPTAGQNYVVTYVPQTPLTDTASLGTKNTCEEMQNIQYYDGLGRPLQTVQVKGNPDATRDVITPNAYDDLGLELTKYLTYTSASGTSGSYRPNALSDGSGVYANGEQYAFYHPATTQNYASINTPFAVTVIEPSPLNRTLEQGAPGDVWQPAGSRTTTTGRTVVTDYGTNDASSLTSGTGYWIAQYGVSIDAVTKQRFLTYVGPYAANQLYVSVSKDENWISGKDHTTEEYKDTEGHILAKRTFNGSDILSTYYVYDDLGTLCFVLPPKAEPDNGSISSTTLDNLCYQYQYDERQRMTSKKLPGKGWEYTVYNAMDKPVASQDARQQANHEWIITKYDALGRAVISGIWNSSMNPTDLKTNVYAQTTEWEYKDNSQTYGYTLTNTYPTTLDTVLTVSYYDNYDITGLPYDYHTTYTANTQGLATATKINVLGTTDMLWTVNYYDDKGRVTHTYAQHYLGGTASLNTANYDHIQNTYDFTNQVTNSTRTHYTNSSGTPNLAVTIANTYVYDHIGRKRQSFEQINSGTNTLISQNDYNEVGQELTKHLHSTDGGSTFLQDVAYSYNERGWLKSSSAQLFAMQLKYNDGTTPQYNGNIANQNWGTPGSLTNSYTYGYDALNRLAAGTGSTGNTENNIQYDKMGNLTQLNRYYGSTLIDQLTYNYTVTSNPTNQLQSVADASADAGPKGYKSGTYTYHYDANGNMDMDNSKGLTISYNLLNLPQTNTLSSGTVSYVYEASGAKLRKISTIGTTTTTDYIGGIQYTNGAIDFIQTEEGRALKSGSNYNYEYNLADHLGNTRLSFDTHTGSTSTTQQTDYMPFGMEVTVGSIVSPKNEYLYNKKELQEELGQYDYGARFYDPVIARWTSVDPKAELDRRATPYNYAFDDPMRFTDPDGMFPNKGGDINEGDVAYFLGMLAKDVHDGIKNFKAFMKQDTRKSVPKLAKALIDGDVERGVHKAVNKWTKDFDEGSHLQRAGLLGTGAGELLQLGLPEGDIGKAGDLAKIGDAEAISGTATGGRLGSEATRAQVYDIGTNLESRGFTITGGGGRLPEEYLPPVNGGRRGGSYPDITAVRDNTTIRINTIDTYKSGVPTAREAANAARIRAQTPGDHLVLIPKP